VTKEKRNPPVDPVTIYIRQPTFGPWYKPRRSFAADSVRRIQKRPIQRQWPERKPLSASRPALRAPSPTRQERRIAEGWGWKNFGQSIILLGTDRLYKKDQYDEVRHLARPLIYGRCGTAIHLSLMSRGNPSLPWILPIPDHLLTLKRSAELGSPAAIYLVGALYDLGEDGHPHDPAIAHEHFKLAAAKGHAHSEWLCGVAYLYGTAFAAKDESKGLEMVQSSARKGFYGAVRMLSHFYENGEFGYPVDPSKAADLRELLMGGHKIIEYT
jgi:hypothetical protein